MEALNKLMALVRVHPIHFPDAKTFRIPFVIDSCLTS